MIPLRSLHESLEGVVPSIIATSDPAGVPNISYLSHVHFVDDEHVALSNQFFSKTAANVQTSGRASVMVVNGRTGQQHVLHLVYVRSERDGPLYERLRVHLAVGAAGEGLRDVMRLRAVDIYRVTDIAAIVPTDPLSDAPAAAPTADHLAGTRQVCQAIASAEDFEGALDTMVAGVARHLGFAHIIVAVPNEQNSHLLTIASHGYDTIGIAAETVFGAGVIGVAAAERATIRVSDLGRANRYAAAVSQEGHTAMSPIPFPGLAAPRSQLAVPVLRGGRLLSVLFAESAAPFAFGQADEFALETIAAHLCTAFALEDATSPKPSVAATEAQRTATGGDGFTLRFDPVDGSVFIDGEYLIRGIPGRLLHYFARAYLQAGQIDFFNRDLRRDTSLQLPEFKDNLETRLILLRRRLDEKQSPLRLERPARGHIRIALSATPVLG